MNDGDEGERARTAALGFDFRDRRDALDRIAEAQRLVEYHPTACKHASRQRQIRKKITLR